MEGVGRSGRPENRRHLGPEHRLLGGANFVVGFRPKQERDSNRLEKFPNGAAVAIIIEAENDQVTR